MHNKTHIVSLLFLLLFTFLAPAVFLKEWLRSIMLTTQYYISALNQGNMKVPCRFFPSRFLFMTMR